MGRRPGELLYLDADAGMTALEIGYQLADDLAFAAHGPELDNGRCAGRLLAAGKSPRDDKGGDDAHCNTIETHTADQRRLLTVYAALGLILPSCRRGG